MSLYVLGNIFFIEVNKLTSSRINKARVNIFRTVVGLRRERVGNSGRMRTAHAAVITMGLLKLFARWGWMTMPWKVVGRGKIRP